MDKNQVKVYGAGWCSMTTRTKSYLDELGVPYEYIDVEQDSAASEWVKSQNGGKEKKPTVDVAGEVISEPANSELKELLEKQGVLN